MDYMGIQQFSSYRLISHLGNGSFTAVYLAEHVANKSKVAVKVFYQQLAGDNEKERFLRESTAITQLKHPGIVQIIELGIENRIPFLIMEYMPNGSLRQRHLRGSIVSPTTVIEYIKQVADALQYLHDHKFVHRNLKPDNIFIGYNDTILLSVPSLAIESAAAHTTATDAGFSAREALDYMAPEHIRSGVRRASDQYALGIITYELLSGSLPFDNIEDGDIGPKIYQILYTEAQPLKEKVPSISSALNDIVMKTLAKKPEQRYERVQEFAIALENAIVFRPLQRPNFVGKQFGNYRLTSLIGQGGFANVYLGEHVILKTQAAIKVLDTKLTKEDKQKFLDEAKTLAKLRHPHIIKVLDFGMEGDIPFLSMDYAPNGTLRQCHPKGTRVSPTTILPYVKQVADALHYAHYRGIIHRDVKPENLLLAKDDQIVLSDFGIAVSAHAQDKRQPQETLGTIQYMAPEQINGKPDVASDQYAFAVVIYEWLCGTCPFTGTPKEIMIRHMGVPPGSLREHTPTLSPTIDDVILRALSKDPLDRYPTILDFAVAFERACQPKQPLMAHMPSTVLPYAPPSLPQEGRVRSKRDIRYDETAAETVTETRIPAGRLEYVYPGHLASVTTVTWASNGSLLASGGSDRIVQVWNQNRTVNYRDHSGDITSIVWSPDGTLIASASRDATVQVRNISTGEISCIYKGHSAEVFALAWSPDGKSIASASDDETVHIWDVTNGKSSLTYPHSGRVNTVSWSYGGGRIASASVANVQVWEITRGGKIHSYRNHTGEVYAVAWSPNDALLASSGADKTVQIWDANTGSTVLTYTGHSSLLSFLGSGGNIHALAWAPRTASGSYIASAGTDKTVHIWNAANGQRILAYRGHTARVNAVAWSSDGRYIASASDDKTVQIWAAP